MQAIYLRRLLHSSAIALLLATPAPFVASAFAQQVACAPPVTVDRPPPPLPTESSQPPIPGPGYIWSPGYWGWDTDANDYYWTPGTWVEPPRPGLLWTPGYWAWAGGMYLFHRGYWGARVGFYGGVDYGHGYTGRGYEGGRWDHGHLFYNRAVNNLDGARITNVYEKTIVENRTMNRISYNGGHGGIEARPTPEEKSFAREQHFAPTALQERHVEAARKDRALFMSENHGKPPVTANARTSAHPGALKNGGGPPAHETGAGRLSPADHSSNGNAQRPGTYNAVQPGHAHGVRNRLQAPNGPGAEHRRSATEPGQLAGRAGHPGLPAANGERVNPAVQHGVPLHERGQSRNELPGGGRNLPAEIRRPRNEERRASPVAPAERHEPHASAPGARPRLEAPHGHGDARPEGRSPEKARGREERERRD